MLEHRQRVLEGIRDRLGPHGFDPDITYRDWLLAFQRIVELSAATTGECTWSAPLHTRDAFKTEADIQRLINKIAKSG